MNFKELKKQIKEEQKTLASRISRGKFLRKPSNRTNPTDSDIKDHFWAGYGREPIFQFQKISNNSDTYRHIHIAYCMFFNKTPYEKIENKTNTPPSKARIDNYIKIWESKLNEVIRNNP